MCTPVTTVASVLSFLFDAMASALMTLESTMILSVSVYQLAALSMSSMSSPLIIPSGLSQVRVQTSAASALLLMSVRCYLIPLPALANEMNVIRSNLSY